MTEPKALKDMTWEEAMPIYEAFHEGRPLDYYSEPLMDWAQLVRENYTLSRLTAYRVKQTKPSVNWDHLRPEIIAIARSSGGALWGYAADPVCDGRATWSCDSNEFELLALSSIEPGTCHWTESKIYRPGHEPK